MSVNSKRRAVFLDRDGTVADEVGYINHLSRFWLYPWSAEAIKKINQAGWAALVLTGDGRGEYEYQRTRWPRPSDWFAENLLDAVNKVLPEMR